MGRGPRSGIYLDQYLSRVLRSRYLPISTSTRYPKQGQRIRIRRISCGIDGSRFGRSIIESTQPRTVHGHGSNERSICPLGRHVARLFVITKIRGSSSKCFVVPCCEWVSISTGFIEQPEDLHVER